MHALASFVTVDVDCVKDDGRPTIRGCRRLDTQDRDGLLDAAAPAATVTPVLVDETVVRSDEVSPQIRGHPRLNTHHLYQNRSLVTKAGVHQHDSGRSNATTHNRTVPEEHTAMAVEDTITRQCTEIPRQPFVTGTLGPPF